MEDWNLFPEWTTVGLNMNHCFYLTKPANIVQFLLECGNNRGTGQFILRAMLVIILRIAQYLSVPYNVNTENHSKEWKGHCFPQIRKKKRRHSQGGQAWVVRINYLLQKYIPVYLFKNVIYTPCMILVQLQVSIPSTRPNFQWKQQFINLNAKSSHSLEAKQIFSLPVETFL